MLAALPLTLALAAPGPAPYALAPSVFRVPTTESVAVAECGVVGEFLPLPACCVLILS